MDEHSNQGQVTRQAVQSVGSMRLEDFRPGQACQQQHHDDHSILEKLRVEDRTQAAILAIRCGLTSLSEE